MFLKNSVLIVVFSFLNLIFFSCSMDNTSTQLIGHYNYNTAHPDESSPYLISLDLKEKAQYHVEIINSEPSETVIDDGIWRIVKENDSKGVEQILIELTANNSSDKKLFRLKNNTTLQLTESKDNPLPKLELKKIVH